jgi:hypothetical protein
MSVKCCEGALKKLDGGYEHCDNVAEHGSEFCWECRELGNTKEAE